MDRDNEARALAGDTGLKTYEQAKNITRQGRPLKWRRVLSALVSGRSFNRFEAERELHDHCLHTTVSVLQGKGLTILRRGEVVAGFQGAPTHVCRYWLAPESRERAAELLGRVPDGAAG